MRQGSLLMKPNIFSTKDVVLIGLMVGVIFTICLFLCSLSVNESRFKLSQDIAPKANTHIVYTNDLAQVSK
jgi:hypothetical protein